MRQKKEIAHIRRTHIGRYLHELDKEYKRITIPYIQENGFDDFTDGQLQIMGCLDFLQPTPMAHVNESLNISKQAISRMIALCEKNNYIQKVSSKQDSRFINIEFTERGRKLMQIAADAIEVAEAEFEKKMGQKAFKTLKTRLAEAYEAILKP